MSSPDPTGELFPDTAAIQASLERRTRDALLRRLGPQSSPATEDPGTPPAAREKARGISFGVDLVRAILDGRKTQTRRPIRPHLLATAPPPSADACTIARVGELLYVREPWLRITDKTGIRTLYAADESHPTARRFRPGMYMPHDAARLWLRVTEVRAERLQAITPADLAAEGLPPGRTLAAVWDGFYTAPGERHMDDPWVWVVSFSVVEPIGVRG